MSHFYSIYDRVLFMSKDLIGSLGLLRANCGHVQTFDHVPENFVGTSTGPQKQSVSSGREDRPETDGNAGCPTTCSYRTSACTAGESFFNIWLVSLELFVL